MVRKRHYLGLNKQKVSIFFDILGWTRGHLRPKTVRSWWSMTTCTTTPCAARKGIGIHMADDQTNFVTQPSDLRGEDVRELARRTPQHVMHGSSARLPLSTSLQQRLNRLCETFLADENEPRHQVISRMRRDGIATSEIIDHVIPELALILGQRWADDDISFVEVTIGSARLQEAVRALVAREMAHNYDTLETTAGPNGAHTPRVLLVIPRSEEHTLGVFVAADQFRRFGYHVDLAVDQHPKQIAAALGQRHYSMIGLTIAGRRTLASARELVDIIRTTMTQVTPIVLGGSLIESDQDLKKATGVDHVVRTVRDALDICGLNIVELDPPRKMMAGH